MAGNRIVGALDSWGRNGMPPDIDVDVRAVRRLETAARRLDSSLAAVEADWINQRVFGQPPAGRSGGDA
ncbi:hypothetical protein AB0C01_28495 [Micromonospora sp. NPDC048905]|uniref:hypothetical protein n=1 Tax=Micromonospora sp. NPDC048905 TaxID=3155494 RepID=UPI0033E42363